MLRPSSDPVAPTVAGGDAGPLGDQITPSKPDHGEHAKHPIGPQAPAVAKLFDAAEASAMNGSIDTDGPGIAAILRDAVSDGITAGQVIGNIRDTRKDATYRAFLIDVMKKVHLARDQRVAYYQVLFDIAENKDEQFGLRRYALLALRGDDAVADSDLGGDELRGGSRLLSVYKDRTNPSDVRGSAITAMQRTHDRNLEAVVTEVLESSIDEDPIVRRHAVVAIAKAGAGNAFVVRTCTVASSTKDHDLYASSIYALGISKTPEAVSGIVSNFGRFGNSAVCRSSLMSCVPTILSMLSPTASHGEIITGIEAARLGQLAECREQLSRLAASHTSGDVRELASTALLDLSKDGIRKPNPKLSED